MTEHVVHKNVVEDSRYYSWTGVWGYLNRFIWGNGISPRLAALYTLCKYLLVFVRIKTTWHQPGHSRGFVEAVKNFFDGQNKLLKHKIINSSTGEGILVDRHYARQSLPLGFKRKNGKHLPTINPFMSVMLAWLRGGNQATQVIISKILQKI